VKAGTAFWLVTIGLALAAIGAGYVQGVSTSRPPPVVSIARAVRHLPPIVARAEAGGGAIADVFANDDVVVDRPRPSSSEWQPERLALVVGLCGGSLVVESGIMQAGIPMAIDLDPRGPDAVAVAAAARAAREPVYVHLGTAPTSSSLRSLHARIGDFDGIAARSADGMPDALRGSGLLFFDERGDADPARFAADGVPLLQRDVTADDRAAPGYVTFMLDRAADLSRRTGTVVVLVRPLPSTLAGLRRFIGSRTVQFLTPLGGQPAGMLRSS
jgi:polysaccharide deacetylase 2 family uncharacterized protein YibQ